MREIPEQYENHRDEWMEENNQSRYRRPVNRDRFYPDYLFQMDMMPDEEEVEIDEC